MDIRQDVHSFANHVGDWAKALWLFLLYFCSIIAVVASLSAYQLQHNIRAYEVGGQPLAIWRVLQYREQWNEVQLQKTSAAERFRAARDDLDIKVRESERTQLASSLAWSAVAIAIERLLRTVQDSPGVPPDATTSIRDRCCSPESVSEVVTLIARLPKDQRDAQAIAAARAALEEANERFRLADEATISALSAVNTSQEQLAAHTEALKAANEAIPNLIKSFGNDAGVQDAVGDFLNQINYLTSTFLGRFFEFATMPTDMLTLILVFAMGTLGGTIHLTRVYLAGEARGVGFFLYRPFLGAITALAIYILARAGVFVLSDPAVEGGRSPLSPFFISFLAIISGLLAEQALTAIENVGGRWFSAAHEQQRWASKVAAEMLAQSKNIADIESLLGVDSTKTSAWLEEREPVPAAAQTALAVWLQKPIRDLFTDLPPQKPAVS